MADDATHFVDEKRENVEHNESHIPKNYIQESSTDIFTMDFIPLCDGSTTEGNDNREQINQKQGTNLSNYDDQIIPLGEIKNKNIDELKEISEISAEKTEIKQIDTEVQSSEETTDVLVKEAKEKIPERSEENLTTLCEAQECPASPEKINEPEKMAEIQPSSSMQQDGCDDDVVDDNEVVEGDDSKDNTKTIDPYSYTKRDEFTSEIFKIEVANLPKSYGYKKFKEMIAKCLKFKPVKIKAIPRATHAFVTFRNEEERQIALKTLSGQKWKGNVLRTKLAKALPDPVAAQRAQGLARKRFIEEAAENNVDAKRVKLSPNDEEGKRTIQERLNNSVTPLWNQPYAAQIQTKFKSMVAILGKLTKQLNKIMELKGSWVVQESKVRDGICCQLLPCIESPVVDGYRNKCEFTIAEGPDGDKTVGFRVGSYRDGYSGVVEPSECIHISDIAKKVAKVFQNYIRQSSIAVYDLCFHKGSWQTLIVRSTQFGESMAIIQFNPQDMSQGDIDKELENIKEFFTEGEGKDCKLTSLYVQVNPTRAVGWNAESPFTLLSGQPSIHEVICGVKFRISPNAFFQVNTKAAEKMFELIREWMGDCSGATLLDICCGTGSIGLSLAKHVDKVIGVELVQSAVEDAWKNAEMNGISNAKFICGKAQDVLVDQVLRKLPRNIPVIGIVDPPRAGLHSTVIQAIRKCTKMDQLIYVSCNPNSAFNNLLDLCRPTSKRIKTAPFRLVKAVPVDLFPHTKHCELVMFFQRDSTSVDAAKFYKFFY